MTLLHLDAAASSAILPDVPFPIVLAETERPALPLRRRGPVVAMVMALRPKQWMKNGLVFLAPVGAGMELHWRVIVQAAMCFLALSLVAGATYLVNDIRDVEADRVHPKKCRRPLAAGEISVRSAWVLFAFSVVAGLGSGYVAGGFPLDLVFAGYAALSMSYSYWFKHQEVLDVASVSMCFVIRVVAGAVATHAVLPHAMLLCTGCGALFMVVGKRYAEFRSLGDGRDSHRKVLANYSESYLRSIFYFAAAMTTVSYCWWAIERAKVSPFAVCFQLSMIPAVVMVMQYALLIDRGAGGSPEDLVLGNRRLQVLGALAAVLFILGGLPAVVHM
ncbi:MAG TPA: decaprenyl-phosphate phosphoribosyltransferase [Acidimicrobiales bacterium]|jgi:decaprenyl-phosphate phosphoribosyltransferase|nr:decaprenyl-phosphate phosphoribosyltransferase [Acidimicrobiales bacterium]